VLSKSSSNFRKRERHRSASLWTIAISHDQDAIHGVVHIAAPPERVFQALTDPRQLLQWWGQKGMYHHTDWKADVYPGGQWRSDGVSDVDGSPYHVSGEYVEVNPPRAVSYTWVASWAGPHKTLVRWELEAASGAWMQSFLEKGETVATRPAIVATPHS
jgi:uncharacterized protein YndB with AHSA1/START domain